MSPSPISIVPMEPRHLPVTQTLSAAVGWPHRIEDWSMALELGHGLVLQESDDVFGSIMWWPFGERHATLGMIIVAADKQGQGHGRRLMETALAKTGHRLVLLNATEEGLPLYNKMGFQEVGTVEQHQGVLSDPTAITLSDETGIRVLQPSDLGTAADLDLQATGWSRKTLLRSIISTGEGLIMENNGELEGYALCRRFGRGHVIGPVVARSIDAARALIGTWLKKHRGGFVRVDTPSSSGLSDWLASHGLRRADRVITMTRGSEVAGTPVSPQVFALASQAFG